jgi:hypothetical protein
VPPTEPAIVPTLRDHVGDKLRVVAEYGPEEYRFLYHRDDIAEGYTEDEMAQIFRDLVLEGMARDHLEDVFHLGDFECGVMKFSGGTVFHFATGEYSGLAVSIDADAEFEFHAFVEDCRSWGAVDPAGGTDPT